MKIFVVASPSYEYSDMLIERPNKPLLRNDLNGTAWYEVTHYRMAYRLINYWNKGRLKENRYRKIR